MATMMNPTLAAQLVQSGRMGQQQLSAAPMVQLGAPHSNNNNNTMTAPGAAAGPPRMDSGPDSPDAWKCPKCDNFNYGGRRVCNMRKCGTPKPIEPWTCPSCGNENHANRPFCNMRTCGLAKPGLSAKDIVKTSGARGVPLLSSGARPVLQQVQQQQQQQQQMQQMPQVQQQQQMQVMQVQQQQQQQQQQQMLLPFPGGGGGLMGALGGNNPPGSWGCTTCGNVNWPTRSACNGKKGQCGMPRGAAPAPDGAWICTTCQNVNWPERTHCNKRSCGAPRSA